MAGDIRNTLSGPARDIALNTGAGTVAGKNGYNAAEATRVISAFGKAGAYSKPEYHRGVDECLARGVIKPQEAAHLHAAIDADQRMPRVEITTP